MCRYFCVSYRQRNRFFKQNWKRAERTQPKSDEGAESDLMYDYFHAHNSVDGWECLCASRLSENLQKFSNDNLETFFAYKTSSWKRSWRRKSGERAGDCFEPNSWKRTRWSEHALEWFESTHLVLWVINTFAISSLARFTSDSFDVHQLMFSRLTGEMQFYESSCA